tara:strand:+ start:243 stop:497 length:255 start_codon:yes stop_codon:yes gene_type:complete
MNGTDQQEFIKIAVLENTIEAQLVNSILDEHNIPHRLHSYHDTAYDGLFQMQKGWGGLRAPRSFKDDILEILNAVRLDTNEFAG